MCFLDGTELGDGNEAYIRAEEGADAFGRGQPSASCNAAATNPEAMGNDGR